MLEAVRWRNFKWKTFMTVYIRSSLTCLMWLYNCMLMSLRDDFSEQPICWGSWAIWQLFNDQNLHKNMQNKDLPFKLWLWYYYNKKSSCVATSTESAIFLSSLHLEMSRKSISIKRYLLLSGVMTILLWRYNAKSIQFYNKTNIAIQKQVAWRWNMRWNN